MMHAVVTPLDSRKEAVIDENIKKVHEIILDDRKVNLFEICETLKTLKESVRHILNEYLGMRKLCAKWVPHELTINQKQQRIDDYEPVFEAV